MTDFTDEEIEQLVVLKAKVENQLREVFGDELVDEINQSVQEWANRVTNTTEEHNQKETE